jgi:NIMA (never in mitosis gene a)-related kinase
MQDTLLMFCEHYILESWLKCQKKLGAGYFGKVYEGTYCGSQKVAYKVTRARLSPDAIRETNILKTLHHPSIVRYIDVIHTSQHTLLVMELIDGGTLYNYIRNNYPSSAYWSACENMMLDVAYAMSYLHEKNIVHADLKSDNILLRRNGKAVLSDFGLSELIENLKAENSDSHRGKLQSNYC